MHGCVYPDVQVLHRLTLQGESLLARWSEEQSLAAAHSLQAARGALLEVQAQAQKQKQNLNAQRYVCTVSTVGVESQTVL